MLNGEAAGTSKSFGIFGETTPTLAGPGAKNPVTYGFTGREYDYESGLNWHRARAYDASVGRWLSQDPIGLAGDDLNFYRYVGNRSATSVDPSGEVELQVFDGELETREEALVRAAAGRRDLDALATYDQGGPGWIESIYPEDALGFGGLAKGGAKAGMRAAARSAERKAISEGGREAAKSFFREHAVKDGRKLVSDTTLNGRGVAGFTKDGSPIRIRFKRDGSTRIQVGDKKIIYPKE